jgi:hypothetical protein
MFLTLCKLESRVPVDEAFLELHVVKKKKHMQRRTPASCNCEGVAGGGDKLFLWKEC